MNEDIKKLAKSKGVRLWKIADKLGISDTYFSCILRYELSEEDKNKIIEIIELLSDVSKAKVKKIF